MKILNTREIKSVQVETDDADYIRYEADSWFIVRGDGGGEPVYDCAGLEKLYQEYCLANKNA